MVFIPIPSTAEIVATYTLPGGNQAKNVFNVREATPGDWNPAALAALGALYVTWENGPGKATRSNQITLTGVVTRDLNSVDSWVVDTPAAIAGTRPTPVMPANVTWAVKATTGRAGRSYRGRVYHIGLAEGDVAGDFVTTAIGNAIVNSLNTLRTTLETSNIRMVVASRFTDGAPRAVGVATDILQWQQTDFRVDTQRRRLIGAGS